MCRCAERRRALGSATAALVRRDSAALRAELAMLALSTTDDLRDLRGAASARLAAAHKRLGRG